LTQLAYPETGRRRLAGLASPGRPHKPQISRILRPVPDPLPHHARLQPAASVSAKKGAILAAMAGAQLSKWSLSLLIGGLVQRPGGVKGAPLLGAAKRTLDGEDRSGRWRRRERGGVAGVSPAGFGPAPQFNTIRSPIRITELPPNRRPLQIPAHSREWYVAFVDFIPQRALPPPVAAWPHTASNRHMTNRAIGMTPL
jgi:hypothetical protein